MLTAAWSRTFLFLAASAVSLILSAATGAAAARRVMPSVLTTAVALAVPPKRNQALQRRHRVGAVHAELAAGGAVADEPAMPPARRVVVRAEGLALVEGVSRRGGGCAVSRGRSPSSIFRLPRALQRHRQVFPTCRWIAPLGRRCASLVATAVVCRVCAASLFVGPLSKGDVLRRVRVRRGRVGISRLADTAGGRRAVLPLVVFDGGSGVVLLDFTG